MERLSYIYIVMVLLCF